MTDAPNDWTDNDLEQLSRIAPNAEKCGAPAASFIPRWGMYWSCELPKGHEGDHRRGGNCFAHGEYVGEKCPHWPNCIAGAPSDRAVKVRNIIEQNISGVMFSSGQPKILVEAIGQLLDAECKAAAAAALEQAAEHIPEQSHEATGYLIRCACGWKSLAYKVDWRIEDGSSRGFSEWQQHIRALSPSPNYIALREAEARIDEATAAKILVEGFKMVGVSPIGPLHGVGWNDSVTRIVKQIAEHVAALTETRDRIAKETK